MKNLINNIKSSFNTKDRSSQNKIIIDLLKRVQTNFNQHQKNAQDTINDIHSLQSLAKSIYINLDDYLYREGLFDKSSAIANAEQQIKKYQKFPAKQHHYRKELNAIKNSHQKWFDNYGVHTGSHNLIKTDIDNWKVRSVLNCILSDMYISSED